MAKKTLPASDGSSSTPTPATTTRKRTTRRAPAAAGTSTGELAVAGAGMGAAEMNAIVAATDGRYDPAFHEIAEAAYLRYLQRGGHHGRDFDDWIEAERELRRRARR